MRITIETTNSPLYLIFKTRVVNKWSTQRVYKSDNYVYSGATNAVVFKPRSSRKQDIVGQLIQLQGGIWQS